MSSNLSFRMGRLPEHADRVALIALINDIFGVDLAAYSALGIWHADYCAFSHMDGETIAANVSIRPLPMMIAGRRVEAGQIHAVATRPPYRRRGLFTDLMGRALDYAGGRFEAIMLFTAVPDLYRPFGFRLVPQHRFAGSLADDVAKPSVRRLSMDSATDRALVLRLEGRRVPVSNVFAVAANCDVLIADALFHPEWNVDLLEDEEAIIIWTEAGGRSCLIDIIATRMPPAGAIAAVLGGSSVHIDFPPDRLPGRFVATPYQPVWEDHIMWRGALAVEGQPLSLPDTTLS